MIRPDPISPVTTGLRAGRAVLKIISIFVSLVFFAGAFVGAETTPLAHEQFLADLARDLAAHFNLEGDLQLELLRPWSPPARVASTWAV